MGYATAVAVLTSNMIGTGVFTSLGFQVVDTHGGFALLALWGIGGVIALCGALSYAELGVAFPHSGGEYVYLGRLYSPLLGFLGGWISMTVGFAAPIALAALAFGRYLGSIVAIPPMVASFGVLVLVALVHLGDFTFARRFQVTLSVVAVGLMVAFVAAGATHGHPQPIGFLPDESTTREMLRPGFAVSLIFVSFAFSGWNAAGYLAGEIRNPSRTIPLALVSGTLLVAALYVAVNWTFLRTVPASELPGVVEVGALSARAMFGSQGGRLMSGMIALLLVGTISAMIMAGSRVTEAVTRDLDRLHFIGTRSASRVPRNAVLFQVVLTVLLLLTNSVERVMTYAGFTLNLGTLLAVIGVFRLRRQQPRQALPYRTWGYPVVPAFFVLASLWTLTFVLSERPVAGIAGLVTLGLGAALFWWDGRPVAASRTDA